MRGIEIQKYVKGPNDLVVSTLPDPVPTSTQYLIAIRAAATNFFDILQIQGKYQHQPKLPHLTGSEFSGEILAVPSTGNPKYKVGDKVFGAAQGAYATKVCAEEKVLHPVPEGWSYEDAAGLYVTAPTSYAALTIRANCKPGDWVLVHAAAGGVGLAAVQIAKALGAIVVATASSSEKLQVAQRYGADHLINYSDKSWPQQVLKLTNGRGVDIVYDPVGMIDVSMKCIAWNGRLLVIGFAGGNIEKVALNRVLLKNISIVGLHWGAYAKFEKEMEPVVWDGLFKLIKEGKYKGTVYEGSSEFKGLNDVGKALMALGSRGSTGKIVVSIPAEEDKAKL